jgi:hypothetical protein
MPPCRAHAGISASSEARDMAALRGARQFISIDADTRINYLIYDDRTKKYRKTTSATCGAAVKWPSFMFAQSS